MYRKIFCWYQLLLVLARHELVKVINMARLHNQNQSPLVKIVYSKVKINGKIELVQMELYADGSLKRSQ